MARVLVVSLCLCLLMAAQAVKGDVAVLQSYFEYIKGKDNAYFAANVISQDTTRIVHGASVALGVSDIINNYLNWADNAARMNGVSEVLVSMAVQRLVTETVLPSIDAAIPPKYLPRGVSFFNPNTPGKPLTLRHLLTHTSTILDAKFDSYKKVSPSSVVTLRAFIEAYFLQSSGGTFSVATDVWDSGTPGEAASFRYAKVNIALLAYVVEQVVIGRPNLVTIGSETTAAAYIQEKILNPLGMSSTYLRTLDGGYPGITYPAGSQIFSAKAVLDYTSAGTATTTTTLHPAYVSDYMYFTTALDLGRLMRSLFLDVEGAYRTAGTTMKDGPFVVDATATGNTILLYQTSQALGIMYFDGQSMCTEALGSAVISKCPLVTNSDVWGSVSAGQYGQTATLCSDTAAATNPTCVTVTLSHNDAGTNRKPLNYILGMVAVAFQEAIGDSSTVEQQTTEGDGTSLYGLYVVLGIFGVILFVFIASFITENLIQPAPVAAGIPVPTATSAKY